MGISPRVTYSPKVLQRMRKEPYRRFSGWDPRLAVDTNNLHVFHASNVPEEEFLRAPALHVGSHGVADFIRQDNSHEMPAYNIHQFKVSPHATIHPHVFSDDEADEASAALYRQHGASYQYGDGYYDSPALNALRENKIIMYSNAAESDAHIPYDDNRWGKGFSGAVRPTTNISLVVPNPMLNLHRKGMRPPTSQPVLPMTYTGAITSQRTVRERKNSG